MITRHHIALAVLSALILYSAFMPADLLLLVPVIAGTITGTILPDSQMKKPKHLKIRSLAWAIAQFSRRVGIPVLLRLYGLFPGRYFSRDDKRLTHSLPGIAVLFVLAAVPFVVTVALWQSTTVQEFIRVFLVSMFFGLVIHLVEDLCTRKGIAPLFPFSGREIAGSVRPCDMTDPRIGQFYVQHSSNAAAALGLHYAGSWPASVSAGISLFFLVVCVSLMISQSNVEIRKGDRRSGTETRGRQAE